MFGWLQEKYKIAVPEIEITYDSISNKYVFKKDGLLLSVS
jgi:hypothetical protein